MPQRQSTPARVRDRVGRGGGPASVLERRELAVRRLFSIGLVGYGLAVVVGPLIPPPAGLVGAVVVLLGALWLAVHQTFVAVDALVAARDDRTDAAENESTGV